MAAALAPDEHLPGIPPGVRRTGVAYPLEHYMPIYGMSERGLKAWLKQGREAKDPCPLDEPVALLAWWGRNKKWQPPARLVALAMEKQRLDAAGAVEVGEKVSAGPVSDSAAAVPVAVEGPAAAEAPSRRVVKFEDVAALSFAEGVEELRKTLGIQHQQLRDALADPKSSELEISQRNKAVRDTMELLRKSEKELVDLRRSTGDTIDRSAWESDLLALLAAIRSIRSRSIETAVAQVPDEVQEVVRSALVSAQEEEESMLRGLASAGVSEVAA